MAKQVEGDSKVFAWLAVFLGIIGFLIVLLAKKDDKYAMFYAKQSLVLFIAAIIVWVVGIILMFIPIIGLIIYWVLSVILLVLWLMGWIFALSGKEKPIPIVGKYAEMFKF